MHSVFCFLCDIFSDLICFDVPPSWGTYNICFYFLSTIVHILLCIIEAGKCISRTSHKWKCPESRYRFEPFFFHTTDSYSFFRYQLKYHNSKECSLIPHPHTFILGQFYLFRDYFSRWAISSCGEWRRLYLYAHHYLCCAWHRASHFISAQ